MRFFLAFLAIGNYVTGDRTNAFILCVGFIICGYLAEIRDKIK